MKKRFLLLLTLILIASTCVAETQEFQIFQQTYQGELMKDDLFIYYEMEDGTAAIASYIGKDKNVDIGASFGERKEIWILPWAFCFEPSNYCGWDMYVFEGQRYECKTKVQKVKLPENVTIKIGNDAFDNSILSQINFPDGLQIIDEAAFANCAFTTLPELPEHIVLPRGAFYGGSAAKLTIPEGYTDLPEMCFWASRTKEYILPSTLKNIGKSAFENSAVSKIVLPSGLTSMGEGAFKDCKKLTSVTLPDTLETIAAHAFEDGSSLSKVVIPTGVKKIDDFAFCACKKLKNISIPASVSEISPSAFAEIPSIVITVVSGSYAETWATTAGYKTKVIAQ